MLEKMSTNGQMLLNGDDELLMKVAAPFRKKVTTFGLGSANDIRAERIRNLGREGIAFELNYHGCSAPVRLRVPGIQNVLNSLGASAIALCLKESSDHVVEGLNRFEATKGRFKLISLPGGATLVDDTYNANPSSLRAAVDALKGLTPDGGKLIVGLGDMLELGDETVPAHLEAGGMVRELGASYFMAIGEHALEMIEGAISRGFPPERAFVAADHREMAQEISDVMESGDLIFLKGSRKMCLEKVAEALMANTEKVV
jgi:UDP-N-acetylmuramoyl-tripeptide--D-alanyl-D-alanine ligase